MIFRNICLYCLLAVHLIAEEESVAAPLPTLSDSEIVYFEMLVTGNNRLGFDLFQQMKQQPGNLYFSSYSIAAGLGMLAVGAKGETARQFQHAFRYSLPLLLFVGDLNEELQKGSGLRTPGQVLLSNGLWLDESVKTIPSFFLTIKRDFRFTLEPVDFAHDLSRSIQKINQSVLKQSGGKISGILLNQDVSMNTLMVLTTAAYLKGQWALPFDRNLTKRLPFQISSQRTYMVEMMQNKAHYMLWKGDQWDVLMMPYQHSEKGAQLSMVIILPKKNVALAELEKNLTWENWKQWNSQMSSQLVVLTLPSFRIDRRLDLQFPLKGLGFNNVFNSQADFSGMTEEKGVFLNAAIHKTSIKIDEDGTDVNARINIKPPVPTKEEETPYEFVADHPFVFMIVDQKTESILFMGRLAVP